MTTYTTLEPIGKDYKSGKAVKADWEKGKDFYWNGHHFNKEDSAQCSGHVFSVRFNRRTKIVRVS